MAGILPINTSKEFYNHYGKTNAVNFFAHPSNEMQASAKKAGAYSEFAQYDIPLEQGYNGVQNSLGGLSGQQINFLA